MAEIDDGPSGTYTRPKSLTIYIKLIELHTLTNSKSKVQVQVWADDWVFIKIRFSNHPASQPASHPARKVKKKQDRALHAK